MISNTFIICLLVVTVSLVYSKKQPCTRITDGCDCETVSRGKETVFVVDCQNRNFQSVPNFNGLYDIEHPIEVLLNENNIETLNNFGFMNLNIIKIDVSNNSIATISSKAFNSLETTLKELILANNTNIRKVSDAISTLERLEKLDLSNNGISSIPDNNNPLANLRELKHLDLSYNSIDIPENTRVFEGMGRLTYLNLVDVGLTEFPQAIINHTPLLERLLLNKNLLSLIPENLHDSIPRLIELDLSKNTISLDSTKSLFKGFTNLTILKLSSCELVRIEANTLRSLTKLTNLTIADCNVETIDPNTFNMFSKMLNLNIGQNRFNITNELIRPMAGTLDTLVARKMGLTTFPKQLFNGMTELQNIYLEDNHITSLRQGDFSTLKKKGLRVHLGNNQLKKIDQKVLHEAPIPVHLYLQNNNITDMSFINADACVFEDMTVDLTGNSINCTCATFKAIQMKVVDIKGVCGTPETYHGLQLNYLPEAKISSRSSGKSAAPSSESLALQFFEFAGLGKCKNVRDRATLQYSCKCKNWMPIGNAPVCSVIGSTASSISFGTFLVVNVISIVASLWFTSLR